MKIIVGLGNPGRRYQNTRHNVGYKVIGELKKKVSVNRIYKRCLYRGWEISEEDRKVVFLRSKTFMNESGLAVENALTSFRLSARDLVVVHDDVSIKLGKIRIRKKGSAGGHNGVASIIERLDTQEFIRIRVGIGPGDVLYGDMVNFVLSEFAAEEIEVIDKSIQTAAEACMDLLQLGIDRTMTKYNSG